VLDKYADLRRFHIITQIIYSEENQWSLTLLFVYQCKILIVVWIRTESAFFYVSPRSFGPGHSQRCVVRRLSGG